MKTKIVQKPSEGDVKALMTESKTRYLVKDEGENYIEYQTDDVGAVRKLVGSDTLNDVTSRGNVSNKEISIAYDSNKYRFNLGASINDNKNFWLSNNINSTFENDTTKWTGKNNTFLGVYNVPKNTAASNNVLVGRNVGTGVFKNNTIIGYSNSVQTTEDSSANTVIGHFNAVKSNSINYSTIIGANNLDYKGKDSNLGHVNESIILGYYNFVNNKHGSSGNFKRVINIGCNNYNIAYNSDYVNLEDLPQSAVLAQMDSYIKESYGIKDVQVEGGGSRKDIPGFSNAINIGNAVENININNPVNRVIGSINIGNFNSMGMWRNYFNIVIGNHITHLHDRRANPYSRYGNVLIGNFMKIWHEDYTLAIHNSVKGEHTHVSNALIYGKFDDRFLTINGNLKLNTEHHKVENLNEFTKQVVAKSDGSLGLMDLTTPKRFILKADTECNITDKKRVEVEDLSFDVVEGKIYKVSIFHLLSTNPKEGSTYQHNREKTTFYTEEYTGDINGKQLSYSFLSSTSNTNNTINSENEDWFENKLKFTNSYYNKQSIEKQFIMKADKTEKIKTVLKLPNFTVEGLRLYFGNRSNESDFAITLLAGSFIEVEEII